MDVDVDTVVRLTLCAVGAVSGWWAFGRPRGLPAETGSPGQSVRPATAPPRAAAPRAPVTLIVPARNEELSIGNLLADLDADLLADLDARLDDRSDRIKVVVVDDHSTDATADVVRSHPDVTLLTAPDLPDGWTGKSWACHVGAEHVTAGTFVFVDADVRLGPGALDAVLLEHRRSAGLVSVQPWHDTQRPYESLSGLFNVVALMGSGSGSSRPTAAFGPVLACSVEDYRRIGGHAAVRTRVAEDLELGRRFAAADLPVTVISCDHRVRYRMYPAGFRQLLEGWTKNYAIGAGSVPVVRLLAVVMWIIFLGSASIAAVEAVADPSKWTGLVLYGLAVAQAAVLFRRVGRFGVLSAALLPLHLAMFLFVFARSVFHTRFRKSVNWRGRSIDVGVSASADADRLS